MTGFPDETFLPDELRDRERFHAVLRALEEANAYLGQAESAARDIDQVLGQLLPHVAHALHADQAFAAAARTGADGRRWFEITVSYPSPALAAARIQWSEWLAGLVATGLPLERAPLDPARAGPIRELEPFRTVSALVVRMEGLGDQRIVGLCGPSAPQDHVFLAEDLKAFKSIIDLLAVGWRVGEKRSRELESIRDSLAVVSAELNPDRVFALVVEQAVKLFDGAPVSLMLWDKRAADTLKIVEAHGLSPHYRERVAIARSNVEKLQGPDRLYTCRILNLRDEPLAAAELVREEGLYWALASPLQTSAGLIGVLNIYSKDARHRFSPSDQDLAQIFAHQVAIAIYNAQLYQESQLQAKHWRALHRSGLTLAEGMTLNRQELLQRIARETVESLTDVNPPKATLGVIRLLDRERNALCFECVYPPDRWQDLLACAGECRSLNKALAPSGRIGIGGRAVITRSPQLVTNVQEDGDYVPFASDTRSELDVPLMDGRTAIGVLSVESDEIGAFDQNDLEVLQGLAAMAVIAHRNSELAEESQLSAAVASMGAWGAEIMHDAHQPLHRLRQGVALLLDHDEWPQELRDELKLLREDIDELACLDLSVLHSKERQTCSLPQMIKREVETAQAGNRTIRWDVEEPPRVALNIEPHWGRRLLRHLLKNAKEHGLKDVEHPFIGVSTHVESGMAHIQVRNNGPQVPEHETGLLFSPRLANPEGRRRGLLVVRFVAEKCGGGARLLHSNASETCFEFWIPVAADSQKVAP